MVQDNIESLKNKLLNNNEVTLTEDELIILRCLFSFLDEMDKDTIKLISKLSDIDDGFTINELLKSFLVAHYFKKTLKFE